MSLQNTPLSNRLHIALIGRTNSGKSTLINAFTGQNTALVSEIKGTTTDPVFKSMEINGIGPVVFIDTAGFDDVSELGKKRIEKTRDILDKTDIALLVCSPQEEYEEEIKWKQILSEKHIPFVVILNKTDTISDSEREKIVHRIEELFSKETIISVSGLKSITEGRFSESPIFLQLKDLILQRLPPNKEEKTITGSLCTAGDVVILVMPQDLQAPKGRLILPQAQVIRELLDKKALPFCCTTSEFYHCLSALVKPPSLIITDSQVFHTVHETVMMWKMEKNIPQEEKPLLTSFSILMATQKGYIDLLMQGAKALDSLTNKSRVLIAEACTHAPLTEDIGREKIPHMLQKKYGVTNITFVSGVDFPKCFRDKKGKPMFDLIIHCGSCMFNPTFFKNRQELAKQDDIPMTNYGITIGYLTGVLPFVSIAK